MVTIRIETGNDAFADGKDEYEIARILHKLAAKIDDGARPDSLFDTNGNKCGSVDYGDLDERR